MVKYIRTITIALFCCLQITLYSQDSELVNIEFKVFALGRDDFEGIYYLEDEKYTSLKFNRHARSQETYSYSGSRLLQIYTENPEYDPDVLTSQRYYKVAECYLREGVRRGLIVFYAAIDNRKRAVEEQKYELYLVNDSDEAFPQNTIKFLNTTGAYLFGKVGQQQVRLPTGASEPIRYDGFIKNGKSVNIVFAVENEGQAKLVMSNDIDFPPNRKILFILQPPKKKNSYRMHVRMLTESTFRTEE